MSSCNVQIFNTTSNTIVSAIVLHSPTPPLSSSDLTNIGTVTNIPGNGTASQTLVAQQSWEPGDYWAGAVNFEGDPTTYFFANDILPICECNVPGDGSCSFVISGSTGNYGMQINTYSGSNWTDGDGSCSEQLLTQAQINTESALAEEIVELILELLG